MHQNVLADRYASSDMLTLWSRENMIRTRRMFWLAVLMVQQEQEKDEDRRQSVHNAILNYEAVLNTINLDSITALERKYRHDVMAEIHEFNNLAGRDLIHQKMTSRDVTENVEQILIAASLTVIARRTVAALDRLAEKARLWATIEMCGRSHNTPAQVTTLGKRFANVAEELLLGFGHLESLMHRYPFRGIKGPMGTQQDLVIDENKVFALMGIPAHRLTPGRPGRESKLGYRILDSVGQVYPRTLDFEVVAVLVELAASMANFAKLLRLMAGLEFCDEGFASEQVGSSAMPHKINPRTCERICGLHNVLKGHLTMVSGIAGDQWYEGDVSCSVVRRVIFPDAFFALDGLYEGALTVLDEMEIYPEMIEAELTRYQPFLATTALLSACIDLGMNREIAHSIIRRHAVRAIKDIRDGRPNTFAEHLSRDHDFPLQYGQVWDIITKTNHGQAEEQIERISHRVDEIALRYPGAASYYPQPIR